MKKFIKCIAFIMISVALTTVYAFAATEEYTTQAQAEPLASIFNTTDSLIEILKIIAQIVIMVASFLLGRYVEAAGQKKAVLEKQFNEFYIVYASYITKRFVLANSADEIYKQANEFIIFLFDNLYLAENKTQKLIKGYLSQTVDSDFSKWDDTMRQITNSVFKDYKRLCRKLKYPKPELPKEILLMERMTLLATDEMSKALNEALKQYFYSQK